jgi:DNA-binding CsgD family transcriptional regulator
MGIGDLTPIELEVLALIAQGHDAKSAARHLSVSTHTIYERLRRAREKVGANNSREAARLVFNRDGRSNEKFVPEKLVLSDAYAIGAFAELPGARAVEDLSSEPVEAMPYRAFSSWADPKAYLPLRAPGERDFSASKVERLRLIGELSARLAMAFVAVCLAAMVVSTILQR